VIRKEEYFQISRARGIFESFGSLARFYLEKKTSHTYRIIFEDVVSKWKEDGSFSLMVYGGCAVIFAGASFVTIRMLRYIGDSDSSIRARRKMLRDRRARKTREKSRSIESRRRRRSSRQSRRKASLETETTKLPPLADEIAATLSLVKTKKTVEMVSIGTQTTLEDHDFAMSCNDVLIGSQILSKLPEDLTLTKLFNGMGMGAYVRRFQSHDIDIDALMLLEQPQLKELGLAIGPRVKLMDIIRLLRHGVRFEFRACFSLSFHTHTHIHTQHRKAERCLIKLASGQKHHKKIVDEIEET